MFSVVKVSSILLFTLASFSCRAPSGGNVPGASLQPAEDADREEALKRLTELTEDQERLLTELSADNEGLKKEKLTLEEKSQTLQNDISKLQTELDTNKTITTAEKSKLVSDLTKLQNEKVAVDTKILDLEKKLKDLETRIKALETENQTLRSRLEAARRENEQLRRELEAAKSQQAQTGSGTSTASQGGQGTTSVPSAATSANSVYAFRYNAKSDCLDIPGSSKTAGVQAISYPCTFQRNQQFTAGNAATEQYFPIKNVNSGLCLGVTANIESYPVLQQACSASSANQQWEFYVRGQADFRLRNRGTGKCMKITPNGNIIQGNCETNYSFFRWVKL